MTASPSLLHVLDASAAPALDSIGVLIAHLADAGWPQAVVCLDAALHRRARARLSVDVALVTQRLGMSLTAAVPLRQQVARHQPAVAHAWGLAAAETLRLTSDELAFCVTVQAAPSDAELTRRLRALMARHVPIVAMNSQVHERVRRRGTPTQRCHLIRPPIDISLATTPARDACRAALGIPDNAPVLLTTPDPTRQGGQYDALWVAAVLEKCWPDVRLIMPGVGPDLPRVRGLGEANGLSHAMLTTGDRYEWPQLLAAADVLIAPFGGEADTTALAWAMVAGTPIVASALPAVTDLIRDGQTGLLAPPGAIQAFAGQVMRLVGDPALGARLGEAASESARRLFDASASVGQYVQLYLSLSAAGSAQQANLAG